MKWILLMSALLLTACAAKLPKVVDVPVVAQTKPIVLPVRPRLPIANLKKNSSPDVVLRSYVVSIKLCQNYNNELYQILKSMN